MHTYTHVYSCTHAHMHACTRALMYSFTHSHIHTCTHALIYVYTHPRTHVLAHTFTHSHMHTCTHLCLHTSAQPTKQPTKQPTTQYIWSLNTNLHIDIPPKYALTIISQNILFCEYSTFGGKTTKKKSRHTNTHAIKQRKKQTNIRRPPPLQHK